MPPRVFSNTAQLNEAHNHRYAAVLATSRSSQGAAAQVTFSTGDIQFSVVPKFFLCQTLHLESLARDLEQPWSLSLGFSVYAICIQ